ncbi:kchip4.2, putative [Ixodes scapularis]|uniref:Kchip4.2, putative n=1 Tax=Ixodes scapularis TaxID=6945 RepID=B7P9C6_IXOSC|nr:kchip4.2, putative [Ixodes scapularis]|eukprot:XP_002403929.1 kchip4.2, putative [Ixodes scapularis]
MYADDPVEEVEVAAVRCQPERIEDLCRSTKFTRQELKFMYQGFKQDFVVGLSALSRGAPVDKLRWAFQLYDLNKDGIISRDEMLDIIVSIHSLVGNSGSASGGDDDDPDSVRDHANRVFQQDQHLGTWENTELRHGCNGFQST